MNDRVKQEAFPVVAYTSGSFTDNVSVFIDNGKDFYGIVFHITKILIPDDPPDPSYWRKDGLGSFHHHEPHPDHISIFIDGREDVFAC